MELKVAPKKGLNKEFLYLANKLIQAINIAERNMFTKFYPVKSELPMSVPVRRLKSQSYYGRGKK